MKLYMHALQCQKMAPIWSVHLAQVIIVQIDIPNPVRPSLDTLQPFIEVHMSSLLLIEGVCDQVDRL